MAEEKDKGNGKVHQLPNEQLPNEVEPYLMIGRFKSTGQIALSGQVVNDIIKFKERKAKEELIEVLIEALWTASRMNKQVEKKSSILRPTNILSGLLGRGGKIH